MRTLAVGKRLIRQILDDKRTLGLMFVAPIFITFLVYTVITSGTTTPVIDVVAAPDSFVAALSKKATVVRVDSEEKALEDLKNREADAYLVFANEASEITLEGSKPTVNKLVIGLVQKSLFEILPLQGGPPNAPTLKVREPKVNYLFGSADDTLFDSLAPLLMGFLIFFFVFVTSGIAFLRERLTGTLERVLATPLRRYEIVLGYFLGFGLFVTIQTVIVQLTVVFGLNVPNQGSFWLVLLLNLLLATMALSLGTFLSAFARNEFQIFQFIPLIIVPQILFSGIFDLNEAPGWVVALSKIFPLTYAAEALRDVMIRGLGFSHIYRETLIILSYAAAFLILNILALKKYRKV